MKISWHAVSSSLLALLLVGCAAVNRPAPFGTTGHDDSNTANTIDSLNPASANYGNASYPSQLYNFASKEDANRYYEQGYVNLVSVKANANACLGVTGGGLTMTPVSCVAYNAGYRGTETGSITFANNATTWVAMDENTSGSNAGLPNFTRVSGTHYLIDAIDVAQPSMASDSQLLMKVVTAGGSITAVTDLRNSTPFIPVTNGVFYATSYGTNGDAIFSGDGAHNSDGTTNGSTTFSSPTGGFTAAMVGDLIFIDGAGTAGGLYAGTVSAVPSSTTITLGSIPPTNVAGTAHYAVGFDNTTALQNWLNAMNTAVLAGQGPEGYLPRGVYLHRGLDLGARYYLKIHGAGVSNINAGNGVQGSTLLCVSPTVSPKVCHDFSGDVEAKVSNITFMSGSSTPEAGLVNVLLDRTSGGTYFGILNTFQEDAFRAFGASNYDVVIYSSEQNSWINDFFNGNTDTAKALYISQLNTPGFSSPTHGSLVSSGSSSTTINNFVGGATQFSSNGTAAITIDGDVGQVVITGGYARLNTATDDFITDTGTTSICNNFNITGMRVEPDAPADSATPSNHFFNLAGSWSGGSIIGGVFNWGNGGTVPQVPIFKAKSITSTTIASFNPNFFPNPEIQATTTSGDNYFANINSAWISIPGEAVPNVALHYMDGVLDLWGLKSIPNTFANLPTCNGLTLGFSVKLQDDNSACTFGTIATGSGATFCPVGCDGTNWRAGY